MLGRRWSLRRASRAIRLVDCSRVYNDNARLQASRLAQREKDMFSVTYAPMKAGSHSCREWWQAEVMEVGLRRGMQINNHKVFSPTAAENNRNNSPWAPPSQLKVFAFMVKRSSVQLMRAQLLVLLWVGRAFRRLRMKRMKHDVKRASKSSGIH